MPRTSSRTSADIAQTGSSNGLAGRRSSGRLSGGISNSHDSSHSEPSRNARDSARIEQKSLPFDQAVSTAPSHTYHRRDKTKSSQIYPPPGRRMDVSSRHSRGIDDIISSTRPGLNERANSAPLAIGSSLAVLPSVESTEEEDDTDEHQVRDAEETDDDVDIIEPDLNTAEEEEIVEDPFFQQYARAGSDGANTSAAAIAATAAVEAGPGISESEDEVDSDVEGPLSPTSTSTRFRPDSVADPIGSPLSTPVVNFAGRMHEINIAVLGTKGVGKSSFIQRVFDHRAPPTLTVTPRKMSVDGAEHTVRLIELPFDDLEIDESIPKINWPATADSRPLPPIDGVLILYNVMDKDSLRPLTSALGAVYKSSTPFILVACKCDYHHTMRELEPEQVANRAKALIGNVQDFEISVNQPGTQKKCLFTLVRTIANLRLEHTAIVGARRRANSAVPRDSITPAPTQKQKHHRASSELSSSLAQHRRPAEYEPPSMNFSNRSRNQRDTTNGPVVSQQQSLLDLSNAASYDTVRARRSGATAAHNPTAGTVVPEQPDLEIGFTWDQLIDKLLAQPLSKKDVKFVATFLALYRVFAAPGQLLEAILRRFNEISLNDAVPELSRTVIQLRHLTVMEQWVSTYPGDFAHGSTRTSMCRFVAMVANTRIFSAAAREIAADLEVVAEDDDTEWACSDRFRARPDTTLSFMSEASTLHDENFEDLIRELSGMTFSGAVNQTAPISQTNGQSRPPANMIVNGSSNSSGHTMLVVVEAAAVQARTFKPNPRISLGKMQWHTLLETPDEVISKELTRMDWIMFSSIRPRDLVRHVSFNSAQKKSCRSLENVNRMINHFNHLAVWVANFVLLREKPKHRALMLEKFIKVARKLREANNYNGLGALLAGINATSVHRLTATRDLVSSIWQRDLMKLELLMGTQKSHSAYRLAWENSSGERIPYLPLHRRDLVTALESNRTWMEGSEKMEGLNGQTMRRYVVDGKERINWKKFVIMGDVVIGIQQAQAVPYSRLAKSDIIRESVLDMRLNKDDDELYSRSVHLEPVGASQEKKKISNWFQRG